MSHFLDDYERNGKYTGKKLLLTTSNYRDIKGSSCRWPALPHLGSALRVYVESSQKIDSAHACSVLWGSKWLKYRPVMFNFFQVKLILQYFFQV